MRFVMLPVLAIATAALAGLAQAQPSQNGWHAFFTLLAVFAGFGFFATIVWCIARYEQGSGRL
jgi:ABC-type transport system involved in cytochrome c biogenesis permease component